MRDACRFFTEDLQLRLGAALANNTHLVDLLLANTGVKETGAVAIGKGLAANASVTNVNLESNRCARAGAALDAVNWCADDGSDMGRDFFFFGVQHWWPGHGRHRRRHRCE